MDGKRGGHVAPERFVVINDHELAAAAQEAFAVAIALDPIEAHHRVRHHIEDRLARRQSPLSRASWLELRLADQAVGRFDQNLAGLFYVFLRQVWS